MENFKGYETLRNKINDLENKLRLRNVRLGDNLDGVEVKETVTFLPRYPPPPLPPTHTQRDPHIHKGHYKTSLEE